MTSPFEFEVMRVSPELAGQLEALMAAEKRLRGELNAATVRFAAVLCACKPRYDRDWPSEGSPAGCVVHSRFDGLFTPGPAG